MNSFKLSILICSLEDRKIYLDSLLNNLKAQLTPDVEIIVAIDNYGITIGEKRNILLRAADGNYVMFLDDDDWVRHNYIERILEATKENKDAINFGMVRIESGKDQVRVLSSMRNKKWCLEVSDEKIFNKVYKRPTNHISAIKRDIAGKIGFPNKNSGEDQDFSLDVAQLIKSEIVINEDLYFYRWEPTKKLRPTDNMSSKLFIHRIANA